MKIEELSDDLEPSLKVSEPSAPDMPMADLLTQAMNAFPSINTPLSKDGTTPELPPVMAAMRNKTGAEILEELNKNPLFMTSLEDNNDDLEALKALAYEGTPTEVSAGFKERGNESFAEKKCKDAKEFYGKAIQVLLAEVRKRQRGEETEAMTPDEIKDEIKILEACLVNRAACHLELKNYRSCVQDCGGALKINRKNVKAWYRSSKALLSLDKILEADNACARGLAIDPENKALKGIAASIVKRNELVAAKRKKELEREQRRRLEATTLSAAIKARGIKLKKTPQPPEMEDAKIGLVPDPVDPASTLSFPAVLLYPLHLESDFIKSFNETQTLGDHLSYILPVPWDKEGEYTVSGVECYVETVAGGLNKVGRKVTLLKLLSGGNVEVVDNVVKIFVVPKAKAAEWIADFKRKKAIEKAGD